MYCACFADIAYFQRKDTNKQITLNFIGDDVTVKSNKPFGGIVNCNVFGLFVVRLTVIWFVLFVISSV